MIGRPRRASLSHPAPVAQDLLSPGGSQAAATARAELGPSAERVARGGAYAGLVAHQRAGAPAASDRPLRALEAR